MPDLEIVPPSLTAAAGPLHEAALLLQALADDRAGMEHLADGSPDVDLRRAVRELVETWELVLWSLASDASSLAADLSRCAQDYLEADRTLAGSVPIAATPAWRDIR